MAIPVNKISDHISAFRQTCSALANAAQRADEFIGLYNALDLGNQITDENFNGQNEGLSKQEFVDAVAAIEGLLKGLNPGVKTVIYKMLA